MSQTSNRMIIDELDDVLDAERKALLEGELDQIGRILPRKEALIDELSSAEIEDAGDVEVLTAKLKRNQDLLDQAQAGIRTVAKRLEVMHRVKSKLDTYDARGAKRTVDMTTDRSVEKRA
ncbi:MAG: flagellar biosynthesis protein FlgN [Pseudomonadota bacterium]